MIFKGASLQKKFSKHCMTSIYKVWSGLTKQWMHDDFAQMFFFTNKQNFYKWKHYQLSEMVLLNARNDFGAKKNYYQRAKERNRKRYEKPQFKENAWGWRDDLTVNSTYCSCEDPGLISSTLIQIPIIPVPGNMILTFASQSTRQTQIWHICIHADKKLTHIKHKDK